MTDDRENIKAALVLLLHACIIWLGCGLTVELGREIFGLEIALALHAVAAPALAVIVSLFYFGHFRFTGSFVTATFFVSLIIILDAALVAPFLEKSYAMFLSIPGTWIPLFLIFLATYFTGYIRNKTTPQRAKAK
jgi:hypothetical protein